MDELKVTPIKPIVLQRSYAYTTDIALYSDCTRHYLLCWVFGFESVEGIPELLGTLVNYTIEDIHQALKAGIDVTEAHLTIWIAEHYGPFEQRGIEDSAMKQIVYQHARSYLEYVRRQGLTVISFELGISSFVGDYLMNGKLDVVMKRNGSYEIIHFKTGRKSKPEGEQVRYKKKLLLYTALWEQRMDMRVDAMRLFYTGEEKSEQVVSFTREETRASGCEFRDGGDH
ncbi:PD-(D/E)XK nuclease family protein [Paenibacillus paeoniae]|uniref:PD-(D/E)XK endonuclease-like domain-containing protein n=1 Tax=Paenibacillus paeoniae TaxID=2292705 RepID=A0A371PIP3_9BACL|nr:PD-(D/E)XK nuclease family protein [Paenibacillus paeoniae]REK76092.1 hypothetical protein DX130_03225 [Paenibacillus paeoniae]